MIDVWKAAAPSLEVLKLGRPDPRLQDAVGPQGHAQQPGRGEILRAHLAARVAAYLDPRFAPGGRALPWIISNPIVVAAAADARTRRADAAPPPAPKSMALDVGTGSRYVPTSISNRVPR